jgi:hypothetical protein
MSVSDQSDYSQGDHHTAAAAAGYRYGGAATELPDDQRNIHQLPDDQGLAAEAPAVPARSPHQRTFSGGSATISEATTGQYSQSGMINNEGGYSPNNTPYELPGHAVGGAGSAPTAPPQGDGGDAGAAGYRGVDPEVPLHQRVDRDRVPIRPGHFNASHNF